MGRDPTHVPDDGFFGVQIRRRYQQQPALACLLCHRPNQLIRDEVVYQVDQRFISIDTGMEQDADAARAKQVLGASARERVGELRVPVDPRKANGAIRAPALTPVTMSNCGRSPRWVRPMSAPARTRLLLRRRQCEEVQRSIQRCARRR